MPMTTEEWIARELAKMPPRSEAFKEETRRRWGLKLCSDSPDDLDSGADQAAARPDPAQREAP